METSPERRWWLALALPLAAASCGQPDGAPSTGVPSPSFVDAAESVGLAFDHDNGARGQFRMTEIVGSGVGLVDVDADGDLDVIAVQGASGDHAAFRNDLESGALAFTDMTSDAGLRRDGMGMGLAAGDVDGDGDTDLFLSAWGGDRLYRNDGGGRFIDATMEAGLGSEDWTTSAAFLDVDADDDLDLVAVAYVDYAADESKQCTGPLRSLDYCGPENFPPAQDRLYRNDGRGRFTDVTRDAGLSRVTGRGLGVSVADFDGDGQTDIYVANDRTENQLWINEGDGTFRDTAVMAGAAVNSQGMPEASMGVTAGDYDADGDMDLFLSHYDPETNTLYRNDGKGRFLDVTGTTGLGAPSLSRTGWGTALADLDNDGRLDLFVANGAIMAVLSRATVSDFPYEQPDQLFMQGDDSRFWPRSAADEPVLAVLAVGRGAAFGDVDNDGDIDIVVANNGGPLRLLLNQTDGRHHWVGFLPVKDVTGAHVPGTLIVLEDAEGREMYRLSDPAGSYLSSGDPRAHFGLGDTPTFTAVRATWPDGTTERWTGLDADRYHRLVRGSGVPVAEDAS